MRPRLAAVAFAVLGVGGFLSHLGCELAFPTKVESVSTCTDTTSDNNNCGACGHACMPGINCYKSMCDGRHVTQVSAGYHACAVVKAGTVFCWGDNEFGETGTPPGTMCASAQGATSTPCVTTATEVPGLDDVIEVRAGFYSTCARKQDGTVWCWGENDRGQLGQAPAMDNPTPMKVPSLAGVTSIDVGNKFACSIDSTSTPLRCWGDDTYGTLGSTVTAGFTSTPTVVPLEGKASAISTGLGSHACALFSNQTAACWGQNLVGALGHDPASDMSCPPTGVPCSFTPMGVAGLSTAVTVSAANGVTCSLTQGEGVQCWGDNGLGQFGNASIDAGTESMPAMAAGGMPFKQLDMRYDFTLAIGPTGEVFAWGSNAHGALGGGTITGASCDMGATCVSSPAQIATLPNGSVTISQVSAGDEFGLALGSDGSVWAWGANDDGRLGHAPGSEGDLSTCGTMMSDTCNPKPTKVPGFP